MPPKKSQERINQETHDTVLELKTILVGKKGTDDKGLLGEFHKLANSYYKLRTRFYLLVGILVGTGLLTGGIWWLNGG